MEWWIWILIGFGFFILEVLTAGTLVVGFFGAGAIATGLIVLAGFGGPAWTQFFLFTGISLASLALFRQPLVRRLRGESDEPVPMDTLVDETGTALTQIGVGAMGRVELRGTAWGGRNIGERPIEAGERVIVSRVTGLNLEVRPEK